MSDETEGPPPLSAQAHEFFEGHAKTGEPTQAELGRALLRLHGSTRPSALSSAGRRFLPPEVMAVAAVLVLSVVGALIGWRVRTANAQTQALSVAKAAWVKGDLDAVSAAFEACSTPECARLAAAVKRAKVADVGSIDEAETGSLLALDRELSGGERSVIADRLEKKPLPVETDREFALRQLPVLNEAGLSTYVVNVAVRDFIRAAETKSPREARFLFSGVVQLVPDSELARAAQKKLAGLGEPVQMSAPVADSTIPPEVAALVEQARAAKKELRFDEAIRALNQCLAQFPDQPDCVVMLASTFATQGGRTNDPADNARAMALYGRFLRVAPPTDKRISRVQEILEGTKAEARLDKLDEEAAAQMFKTAPAPSQVIRLKAGERRALTIKDLERVSIGDAAIADIIASGADDFEVVGVKAGSTTMVAAHDGRQTTWRVTVSGSLPHMGELKIASNPTNAMVIVDGTPTGRRTPVLPTQPLVLPVGKHTLQFELNGKRSPLQRIDVVEGSNPVFKGEISQ